MGESMELSEEMAQIGSMGLTSPKIISYEMTDEELVMAKLRKGGLAL